MKNNVIILSVILFLGGVILSILLFSGYSTFSIYPKQKTKHDYSWVPKMEEVAGNMELTEDQAKILAYNAVYNSEEYKTLGKELKEVDHVKLDCWGCYDFLFQYEKKLQDNEEEKIFQHAKVELRSGKITNVELTDKTSVLEGEIGTGSGKVEEKIKTKRKMIIEEMTDSPCRVSRDCVLPSEYAISSVCAYETRCIDQTCAIVCMEGAKEKNDSEENCPSGYYWCEETRRCTLMENPCLTVERPKVCTREYNPVCALVQVQCIASPCPPVWQTFGNKCEAERANILDLVMGACPAGKESPYEKKTESEICKESLIRTRNPEIDGCFERCCDKEGTERIKCNEACIQ